MTHRLQVFHEELSEWVYVYSHNSPCGIGMTRERMKAMPGWNLDFFQRRYKHKQFRVVK